VYTKENTVFKNVTRSLDHRKVFKLPRTAQNGVSELPTGTSTVCEFTAVPGQLSNN
jgi:hypothetical protein